LPKGDEAETETWPISTWWEAVVGRNTELSEHRSRPVVSLCGSTQQLPGGRHNSTLHEHVIV